jgi:hypothetical protein
VAGPSEDVAEVADNDYPEIIEEYWRTQGLKAASKVDKWLPQKDPVDEDAVAARPKASTPAADDSVVKLRTSHSPVGKKKKIRRTLSKDFKLEETWGSFGRVEKDQETRSMKPTAVADTSRDGVDYTLLTSPNDDRRSQGRPRDTGSSYRYIQGGRATRTRVEEVEDDRGFSRLELPRGERFVEPERPRSVTDIRPRSNVAERYTSPRSSLATQMPKRGKNMNRVKSTAVLGGTMKLDDFDQPEIPTRLDVEAIKITENTADSSFVTSSRSQKPKRKIRRSESPQSLEEISFGSSAFSTLDISALNVSVGAEAGTFRRPPPKRNTNSAVPKKLKKIFNEGMNIAGHLIDPPRAVLNRFSRVESWLSGTTDPFVDPSSAPSSTSDSSE